MKRACLILMTVTAALLMTSQPVRAQSSGDYQSHQSGDWNSTATWEWYNKGNWRIPATAIPTAANETITIRTGHTVTLTAAVTADQVVIQAGGQLTVGNGVTFTIANGTGVDLDVSGILQNSGVVTLTSGAGMTFESGGRYQHSRDGGTIPTATWNSGAICEINGVTATAPAGLNQPFHHWTWDCPAQITSVTLGGNPTSVNGNLTVNNTGGRQLVGVTGTNGWMLAVGGDLILAGGSFNFSSGTAGILALTLAGSYNQTAGAFDCSNSGSLLGWTFTGFGRTFARSAGTFTSTRINFTVATNAFLTLNNDLVVAALRTCTVNGMLNCGNNAVTGAGAFTLVEGGTLGIGHANGISAAAASGNIQVTGGRVFAAGGNYTYNGTGAQVVRGWFAGDREQPDDHQQCRRPVRCCDNRQWPAGSK